MSNNDGKILRVIRYRDICGVSADWWIYDTATHIEEFAKAKTNANATYLRAVWVYDPLNVDAATGKMDARVYIPYATGTKCNRQPMPATEFDPRDIRGTVHVMSAVYDDDGSTVSIQELEGLVPQAAYFAALATVDLAFSALRKR